MKKRAFQPDFTSLLDVIMIILFFFILFSRLDIGEAQKKAKDAMQDAAGMMAEAESKAEEAEKKEQYAQDLIDQLEDSDARAAENAEGLADFKAGVYLRFILTMEQDAEHWTMEIRCADTVLDTVETADARDVADRISAAFEKQGYAKDDTVIGLFEYDGAAGGTYAATKRISRAFRLVGQEYKYLYISDYEIS